MKHLVIFNVHLAGSMEFRVERRTGSMFRKSKCTWLRNAAFVIFAIPSNWEMELFVFQLDVLFEL